MNLTELEQRYQDGKQLCYLGGQTALKWFQSPSLTIEWKSDASPVSLADRSAEDAICQAIRNRYPEDAILGEERGTSQGSSGWQWIIDPIDGTQSFIRGVPLWGTLIALAYQQDILAGWVYIPATGDFVCACPDLLAGTEYYRQVTEASQLARPGQSSSVAQDPKRLADAIWCHTSPDYFADTEQLWIHDRLQASCQWTRAWSDCYAFVLLATGRVDLVVEPALNIWDVAPFEPIIRAANGVIGDFKGNHTVRNGSIIAGNKALYQATLELIQSGA